MQVCPAPDSTVTLEAPLDLPGVRANGLADSRDLIDERDRCGQKSVDGMLGHLGRLHRHPFDLRCKWRPYWRKPSFVLKTAHSHNYSVGVEKHINGLTQAKIFRRAGEPGAILPAKVPIMSLK